MRSHKESWVEAGKSQKCKGGRSLRSVDEQAEVAAGRGWWPVARKEGTGGERGAGGRAQRQGLAIRE